MACKIIWSIQAREDLRDIITFIRHDKPGVAASFGYALIKSVDILEQFPLMGRRAPEFGDENIREIVFRPYRIIYVVREDRRMVAIARIWHGARGEPDVPAELQF